MKAMQLFTIFTCLILASHDQARAWLSQKQVQKTSVLVAVVTDTKGESTTVEDLEAVYIAPGTWYKVGLGGFSREVTDPPTHRNAALHLHLEMEEGRIKTEDDISIPFREIHLVTFGGLYEGLVGSGRSKPKTARIEKNDGSVIILTTSVSRSPDIYEELDHNGQQKRKLELSDFDLQDGEYEGKRILLEEFVGKARTSSGREGSFKIEYREVQKIEFRTKTSN